MKWCIMSITFILMGVAILGSCVHDDVLSRVFPLLKDHSLHFDLFLHAGIFVALTFMLSTIIPLWAVVIFATLFGLGLEVLQGFAIDGREFAWLDFAADFAGIMAGIVLYHILLPRKCKHNSVDVLSANSAKDKP